MKFVRVTGTFNCILKINYFQSTSQRKERKEEILGSSHGSTN
jgi:hypothetical protein